MRRDRIVGPLVRPLIEHRLLLSLGLSIACGIVLQSLCPVNTDDPMLRLIALERPAIFQGLLWSYNFFLYSTPFLAFSMVFSLLYVHLYRGSMGSVAGTLPPWPDHRQRRELYLVLGEVHHALRPIPSRTPRWLAVPERGLYTGIAVVGATGSGKTRAVILPAIEQLFAYRATDAERKLSGIVLEVKGDLCRHTQRILAQCGREQDYIEISLDGPLRYNPLNNSLDPYAQAFNIASIIIAIWGAGKEPFWQQSYTDLVRYVILLHRVRDNYVTLLDVFRTVISAGALEDLLIETGARFSTVSYLGVGPEAYQNYAALLAPFEFKLDPATGQYMAQWNETLECVLAEHTDVMAAHYRRRPCNIDQRDRW